MRGLIQELPEGSPDDTLFRRGLQDKNLPVFPFYDADVRKNTVRHRLDGIGEITFIGLEQQVSVPEGRGRAGGHEGRKCNGKQDSFHDTKVRTSFHNSREILIFVRTEES